jgi:hypothetical protein
MYKVILYEEHPCSKHNINYLNKMFFLRHYKICLKLGTGKITSISYYKQNYWWQLKYIR